MARPIKKEPDYVPLDTDLLSNRKIRQIKRKYGSDAFHYILPCFVTSMPMAIISRPTRKSVSLPSSAPIFVGRIKMLQFGKRHLKRLQAKELFPYGLPLETTLCRVFQSIDNEKMADRMSAFAEVFRREISASARIKDLCAMGLKTP